MQTYFNFDLIDVIGKRSVPGSFMTVEDGIIKELGKASDLTLEQKNAAVDLKGMTVMPGMFNTHIHALSSPIAAPESLNWETPGMFALRGLRHLQQHLASGVTFVRDMNGRKLAEVDLKNALKLGLFEGPTLQICRQCLCMTGGHGCNTGRECDGPEDCRRAAREQIKGGADFVKIMATGGVNSDTRPEFSQLDLEEMKAAITEAHRAGKKTATHAHGKAGIKTAVLAGIDSVEHGSYIDDECIELMLERGTALCPTLSTHYFTEKFGASAGIAPWKVEKSKRASEAQHIGLEKAWKAGIPITIGTDAGTPYNPHWGTYMEFVLFVEDMGFDPMETLISGTIRAARICGVEDQTGSITPGKAADFIVLRDDPLVNIRTLGSVEQVYKNGKLADLPPIDKSVTD